MPVIPSFPVGDQGSGKKLDTCIQLLLRSFRADFCRSSRFWHGFLFFASFFSFEYSIRSWEENTEGYSVKIVGYEVMEKEKYFSKYDLSGKDQSVADPFAYIMEVTIKIKNEENETGKLQIADWALIGKNDDFIAYLDQQLLMDTDERVNGVLSSISTASGKEIEIKLPYPLIYMDKEKEIDRNMPYKIAVTKYPSRKYIQFG